MKNCEEQLIQIIRKSIKKTKENLNCECQNTLNDAII